MPEKRKKWCSKDLVIFSEFPDLTTSLISDALMELVFSDKSMEKHGKYFLKMHISDQFQVEGAIALAMFSTT